jgi:GNAT superfamily N-acetyltransferase
MPVFLRRARVDDADRIAQLTRQLGYDCERADVAARLARILDRHDQEFVVAEASDVVAGWVHTLVAEYVDHEAFVLIAGLVVDRDYRRRGIGRRLLNHAEEWAWGRGCRVVRLTSSTTRTHAHRFYEQLGYVSLKTQYSFARSLGDDETGNLIRFVPRVEERD